VVVRYVLVQPPSSTIGVYINPENGSSKFFRTSLTMDFQIATLDDDGT